MRIILFHNFIPAHDLFHLGGQARDEGHGSAQEQEDDDEGSVGEYLLQGVKVRDPANEKQNFHLHSSKVKGFNWS